MKEPESLSSNLHVLVTMDDRTHIITREQARAISEAQNSGGVKTISIGNCYITLHQIVGMPTLDVYRRQMKTKLAEKHQRMCRRCGEILPMADRCSCVENNTMSFMAQASKENPTLKSFLEENGMKELTLPPMKHIELPEAPPTEKEKKQIAVYQSYKNKLLGRSS